MRCLLSAAVAVALLVPVLAGCGGPDRMPAAAGGRVGSPAGASTAYEPPSETPAAGRARAYGALDGFDRHAHSLTSPSSIWVIVNKKHPLDPVTFVPDLTVVDGHYVSRAMTSGLSALLAASDRAGHPLHVASAYRSYAYQQHVFGGLVAQEGQAAAERWSARPGYSEHQTGLAADLDLADSALCSLAACFARTPGGRWLAANAWRFGFVIRYTAANSRRTGYDPEPWHVRYVGRPLARELHRTHASSLEAYFHVSGGGYSAAG